MKYLLLVLGIFSASVGFYYTEQYGDINSFLIGAGLGVLLVFVSVLVSVSEMLNKKKGK